MSTTKRSARAVADLSRGAILAVVEIEVPPERVFRALTDPDELVQWWGSPDTYQLTESTMDLRVGGRWRTVGRGATGPFTVSGEFLEIDPPRRLVQSFRALWGEDVKREGTSRVTWEIEPVGDSCRLTVTHDQLREDANNQLYGGWPMLLSGLKTLLETGEMLTTPGSLRWSADPKSAA